jgi:hypothetical protein
MHKLPATSWAKINPRLSSSRTAATSKTVGWSPKASTHRLAVLEPLFCLAAVVLPIVPLTTAALADDDKTYVGAECRSIDPGVDPILLAPDNGTMFNTGQREQTWICPVVRDSVDQDPEFARISVIENGSDKIACTFEARGTKGEGSQSASPDTRVESILSTNPLQLVVMYSYGSGESTVLSGVPFHGYYFFRCKVPGSNDKGVHSGVVTYIVTEQD